MLVSIREPGAVLILDKETDEIIHLVAGRAAAQHSPKFLPDGTVAVLDNLGGDRALGGSRIVRIDMLTSEAETLFPRTDSGPAVPFATQDAGHLEVSPDGKRIMVASTHQSHVFEFDVETGDVVWEMEWGGK